MSNKKQKGKHLIEIEDIRVFHGVLTGKTVKPIGDTEISLKRFNKGDHVLVFNYEDFMLFLKDLRIGTKKRGYC